MERTWSDGAALARLREGIAVYPGTWLSFGVHGTVGRAETGLVGEKRGYRFDLDAGAAK